MKALIVDDNPIAREMLRAALIKLGHEVQTAHDSGQALGYLAAHVYDLMLADCESSSLDGFNLCREISQSTGLMRPFIVLMTSRGRAARAEGVACGADDFLDKPFDAIDLSQRLRGAARWHAMQSRETMLVSVARLADARDPGAGRHIDRVGQYTRLLARQLAQRPEFSEELSGERVHEITLASVLHDIGTLVIPDCIFLKPGRLSDSEFAVMKTHTTAGARTLSDNDDGQISSNLSQTAVDIALTHHERFGGGGYPQGLKGEQIPLCGRIVALADVYDALTSHRVYRAALDARVARAMIFDGSGTDFDPRVVDAFVQVEAEMRETRNQHTDMVREVA